MILYDFKAFPRYGRLIGIDWGARRTGVTVSDEAQNFVFVRPQIVVKKPNELVDHIVQMVQSENIVGIVIGLPLRTDGTESETTSGVREFANSLVPRTDLPIIFVDETLTSATAQEQMGRVRRDDIRERLDSESARVILENAIAIIKRAGK